VRDEQNGVAPGYPQHVSWLRAPTTGEYWKVLGFALVYGAVFALSAVATRATADGINQPTWITVILAVVAIGISIFVLIWGAILASRQIRQNTGYPSTPDGLILMLFTSSIAVYLISLPFAITAWAFTVISLPLVVWGYLAVLRAGWPSPPRRR